MKNWKILIGVMRLPFVILAPACVLVGVGTAYWTTGSLNLWQCALAIIGGLAAHICVNVFNEVLDFRTGLDSKTRRTPFSGGSGTLQAHPELARAALMLALFTFAITGAVGLYFVQVQGWGLLPIGILGMVLLYGYTAWFVYHPLLCLLSPGLGFGPLMVIGTHYALTGQYSLTAAVASLVPFFLVSDLLLLNEFPDVEADRRVGRKHLPIVIGRERSASLYFSFLAAAYVVIIAGVMLGVLPPFSLLALATIFIAANVFRQIKDHTESISRLLPALAQNVLISLVTPLLLTIGSFIR